VNRVLWRSVAVVPRDTFREKRIQAFADALMRDPRRAAHIRDIKFAPWVLQVNCWIGKSILPDYPSEQLWSSLEEALRLLTRVERLRLFCPSHSVPNEIGRLISIVGIVFQPYVARLDTNLDGAALHRLCGPGAWPALTTLSTGGYNSRSLMAFSPSAFPQLLHVKSDRDSLIHIVPRRPIQTVYHNQSISAWGDGDLNALKRLQAALQGCKTLRKARLCCTASINVTDFLTGFSHDNLRQLYLLVRFKGFVYGDGHLLTSLVMLVLPPGFLQGFPKLESLQILMFHSDVRSLYGAKTYSKDMKTVVEVLSTFLRLEHHSTLKGIDVGLWGSAYQSNQNRGEIHFVATRRGNLWDVDVVNRDRSVMPGFDDML